MVNVKIGPDVRFNTNPQKPCPFPIPATNPKETFCPFPKHKTNPEEPISPYFSYRFILSRSYRCF